MQEAARYGYSPAAGQAGKLWLDGRWGGGKVEWQKAKAMDTVIVVEATLG